MLSLVVLVGLVGGIVFGAKALIGLVNPADEDYTGQGTGSVQVRVAEGDTLSDIGRTLVDADVIASVGPFVTAAETQPAATGIQPGVYGMRSQMSGAAALDLLLDPATRLFSRVTIPEGFTVTRVLERLAEETDTPIEELNAAAVDPAAHRAARRTPTGCSRAGCSRRPTSSSRRRRRRRCSRRWSPGPCRRSTPSACPRTSG